MDYLQVDEGCFYPIGDLPCPCRMNKLQGFALI